MEFGRKILPFWERVDDSAGPTECWPWTAAVAQNGYGKVWWEKGPRPAHRVAFWIANQNWPNICRHSCDNKVCCNPLHLIDGTSTENNRDTVARGRYKSANKMKTHCPRGHAYSGGNVYVYPSGHRSCRTCRATRKLSV